MKGKICPEDRLPKRRKYPPVRCCDFMYEQLNYDCPQHEMDCADKLVEKGESGTIYLRSPNATYELNFCPSCGAKIRYGKT